MGAAPGPQARVCCMTFELPSGSLLAPSWGWLKGYACTVSHLPTPPWEGAEKLAGPGTPAGCWSNAITGLSLQDGIKEPMEAVTFQGSQAVSLCPSSGLATAEGSPRPSWIL